MTEFDELRELNKEIEVLDKEICNEWEGLRIDYLMNKKYRLQERIKYIKSCQTNSLNLIRDNKIKVDVHDDIRDCK